MFSSIYTRSRFSQRASNAFHRRGPTQYRYTFVPTGTFLYIHSMSSSVMRMQPCDAEVPIDFWNGVPWIW